MEATKTAAQRYVAAWNAVENPPLDKVNPHFRNKYASLSATLGAVRMACQPQGIAYIQTLRHLDDGACVMASRIVTDEGEAMDLSEFPVTAPANPQAFGSNLTYTKRQQAQADWGIVGEEDDDGEAAASAVQKKPAGTFVGRCRSCGKTSTCQNEEQMRGVKCCPSPNYEVI